MKMWVLAIVGVACIGLGIYVLTRKPQASTQLAVSSVTLPMDKFNGGGWSYGPTVELRYGGPVAVWMGGSGEITYPLTITQKPTKPLKITVTLSSELKGDDINSKKDLTSDVTLSINGQETTTINVMKDNDYAGKPYTWIVPEKPFEVGTNMLTFQVKKGIHPNGLNVWSPITVQF
jgi:hypothetical protein